MKKRPVVVRLVGAVLALVLIWHGLATVIYLSGSTRLANIAGPGTINAYMTPIFKQYWSVFAPDPIHEDTELEIRATVDGSSTEWFNVSKADVNRSILHHPVPSRLYLTNFQLTSHYQVSASLLPEDLQQVPGKSYVGQDWQQQLKQDLAANGSTADAEAVAQFIKDETAMTSMASSVARARWGDGVTRVQIRIATIPVKPYPVRKDPNYQVKTTYFDAGWRQIVKVPDIDLAAIASMYGKKAVTANAGQ
ncbi:hypothetical protein IV498_00560 [Paenarthrobacter sp. Z7-10]|uniref:DUF5819 family protein n=1 Tax=Paenarthrobacter sp. Z7-10 TaxID=2787635 RepID=UPI0022A9CBD2|nr:DUF5819 family protein [Paenarthrobacter sp. Z7-10]MCZ2401711.1 hypothetical protein [Paenarthrobacter sp. Z7-10]